METRCKGMRKCTFFLERKEEEKISNENVHIMYKAWDGKKKCLIILSTQSKRGKKKDFLNVSHQNLKTKRIHIKRVRKIRTKPMEKCIQVPSRRKNTETKAKEKSRHVFLYFFFCSACCSLLSSRSLKKCIS